MKSIYIFLSIICNLVLAGELYAQTIKFERVPPFPPLPANIADFEPVSYSSIAFADVDNDNDQDVLITGDNTSGKEIAKLYINNGTGSFTEVPDTPFDGIRNGSIAFADVDNDFDLDVLISGYASTKLYTNNGRGSFSEVTDTPFRGVRLSSVVFLDFDNDSDQDVFITGLDSVDQKIAILYTNNGSGEFTEVEETFFDGYFPRSIAFVDVDNDDDQDVLFSGFDESNQRITLLFVKDENGRFTEVEGTPFDGVYWGAIAIADVDNDHDQDVIITGNNNSYQNIAKLYTNDGYGSFTEVSETPFEGVYESSVKFADVDNDNDQDVFITGLIYANQASAKLYTNDGTGNFTEVPGTSIDAVHEGSIAFADVDNDHDQDILITGFNDIYGKISKLYSNDGNGGFSEVTGTPFQRIDVGSAIFTDVDSDNDQDLLIAGFDVRLQALVILYSNHGNGQFTEVSSNILYKGIDNGSIAFSDVDNDSDLDIFLTGWNYNTYSLTRLYINEGNGNYTGSPGGYFDLQQVEGGSFAFADVDGDNDQDIFLTGWNDHAGLRIAKLYTNDGSGRFTEVSGTPFEDIDIRSVAFGDVDNDNDQDLLISGSSTCKLYTNNGSGGFAEVFGSPFEEIAGGRITFADVDNDSDQDVIIMGTVENDQYISKLFFNDGQGSFAEASGAPFEGVYRGFVKFADVDNDSDQDVLINGVNGFKITKLFSNNGHGGFSEVHGMPFMGVSYGSIAFSDVDGDNDQDVLITGENDYNQQIALLYRNISCYPTTGTEVVTACDSFTWIDGNTYFASNDTATFTLTNAGGCDSVVSLDLTINRVTDLTISMERETITANNSQASYVWLDCDNEFSPIPGETNQSFTATTNGNYAVQLSENGCADTSACINITTVGITANSFEDQFNVYPNPTHGDLTIEFEHLQENLTIRLLSITGQLIETYKYQNTNFIQLNLNQPSGWYTLEFSNDHGNSAVVRLIILFV